MHEYTVIDSDEALAKLRNTWKENRVTTIAMDFEGEYNLHIYGEHLCLIQIFDQTTFYLIDPFEISIPELKRFLEDETLEKIMFDCASDAALVRKNHEITLKKIYDLRIAAKQLGMDGGLSKVLDHYLPDRMRRTSGSKKKHQQTNWLIRPLSREQIQYALEDVEHLFSLKALIIADLEKRGLKEKTQALMESAGLPKGPDRPAWTKYPAYRHLSKEERILLKHYYLAREHVAKRRNVPAVRIMDKKLVLKMAKEKPQSREEFESYTQRNDLLTALSEAHAKAMKEIASLA